MSIGAYNFDKIPKKVYISGTMAGGRENPTLGAFSEAPVARKTVKKGELSYMNIGEVNEDNPLHLSELSNGRYTFSTMREGRTYKGYVYVHKEGLVSDLVPWIVRGGVVDAVENYQAVCDALAQQSESGVAVYLEQTNRPIKASRVAGKSPFAVDAADTNWLVETILQTKQARLLTHSLSTIEGAEAVPSGLYQLAILASPVGLVPGSLRLPAFYNDMRVKALGKGSVAGEELSESAKALRARNLRRDLPGTVKKMSQRASHLSLAETGALRPILESLSEQGITDIVLLIPHDDPYAVSVDTQQLQLQLDECARASGQDPSVLILSPVITNVPGEPGEGETRSYVMHGFVSLGHPETVAKMITTLVSEVATMKARTVVLSNGR